VKKSKAGIPLTQVGKQEEAVADLKNGMLDFDVPIPEFEGAWGLMTQSFKLFMSSFGMILFLLLLFRWPFIYAELILSPDWQQQLPILPLLMVPFVHGFTEAIMTASLIFILLHKWRTKSSPRLGEAFGWGLRRMWRVFGFQFAFGLAVGGGVLLLVVPGVLVALWYCFAEILTSIEKGKRPNVFIRSKNLAVPNWRLLLPPTILLVFVGILSGLATHYAKKYELDMIWFWPVKNFAMGMGGCYTMVLYLLAFVKIAKQQPDIVYGKEPSAESEALESA
jgi:hypothetical protein